MKGSNGQTKYELIDRAERTFKVEGCGATFANADGLNQVSDSAYTMSANSGPANVTAGGIGKAGRVVGGSLEGSNVDTAEQFVHLIEAQRGFQANSRVITAQDEVLRDLVNLV